MSSIRSKALLRMCSDRKLLENKGCATNYSRFLEQSELKQQEDHAILHLNNEAERQKKDNKQSSPTYIELQPVTFRSPVAETTVPEQHNIARTYHPEVVREVSICSRDSNLTPILFDDLQEKQLRGNTAPMIPELNADDLNEINGAFREIIDFNDLESINSNILLDITNMGKSCANNHKLQESTNTPHSLRRPFTSTPKQTPAYLLNSVELSSITNEKSFEERTEELIQHLSDNKTNSRSSHGESKKTPTAGRKMFVRCEESKKSAAHSENSNYLENKHPVLTKINKEKKSNASKSHENLQIENYSDGALNHRKKWQGEQSLALKKKTNQGVPKNNNSKKSDQIEQNNRNGATKTYKELHKIDNFKHNRRDSISRTLENRYDLQHKKIACVLNSNDDLQIDKNVGLKCNKNDSTEKTYKKMQVKKSIEPKRKQSDSERINYETIQKEKPIKAKRKRSDSMSDGFGNEHQTLNCKKKIRISASPGIIQSSNYRNIEEVVSTEIEYETETDKRSQKKIAIKAKCKKSAFVSESLENKRPQLSRKKIISISGSPWHVETNNSRSIDEVSSTNNSTTSKTENYESLKRGKSVKAKRKRSGSTSESLENERPALSRKKRVRISGSSETEQSDHYRSISKVWLTNNSDTSKVDNYESSREGKSVKTKRKGTSSTSESLEKERLALSRKKKVRVSASSETEQSDHYRSISEVWLTNNSDTSKVDNYESSREGKSVKTKRKGTSSTSESLEKERLALSRKKRVRVSASSETEQSDHYRSISEVWLTNNSDTSKVDNYESSREGKSVKTKRKGTGSTSESLEKERLALSRKKRVRVSASSETEQFDHSRSISEVWSTNNSDTSKVENYESSRKGKSVKTKHMGSTSESLEKEPPTQSHKKRVRVSTSPEKEQSNHSGNINEVSSTNNSNTSSKSLKAGKKRRNRNVRKRLQIEKRKYVMKPPCSENCRKMCSKKFTEENRYLIWSNFRNLSKQNQRNFISRNVLQKPKKITTTENSKRFNTLIWSLRKVKVCRPFFLNTLGFLNAQPVFTVLKANTKHDIIDVDTQEAAPEQRGKTTPWNAFSDEYKEGIMNFVEKIKPTVSHYNLKHAPKRRYLPCGVCFRDLFRAYLSHCDELNIRKCSWTYFHGIIKEMNLSTSNPIQDLCTLCQKHKEEHKESDHTCFSCNCKYCLKLPDHILNKTESRKSLENDLKNCPFKKIYTVDMQKAICMPKLTVKDYYFSRKLVLFNETFASPGKNEQAFCVVWHEGESGRKAHNLASSYVYFIINNARDYKEVVFYCDNCSSQNKNRVLVSAMIRLINSPALTSVQKIRFVYFEPGHTYMAADTVHACIANKYNKVKEMYDLTDYTDKMRNSRKNMTVQIIDHRNMFLFKDELKTTFPNNYNIKALKVIEFRRGTTSIFAKNTYTSDEFKELKVMKKDCVIVNNDAVVDQINDIAIEMAPRGISAIKKKELLKLCESMPITRRIFFEDLIVSNNVKDLDTELDNK